jgi:pilus assembly protein CpaE
MNGGAPERLGDGAVRSALDDLAAELAVVAHSNGRRRLSLRGLRGLVRAGSGQVSVETIGVLWLALILILVLWQIALVGYTFALAGHAARNGSRALAVGESVERWAEEGVPAPWREEMRVSDRGDEVRVTMRVPLVIPGVHTPLRVTDRKQTVVEGGGGGLPFGTAYRAGPP